MIEAPSSSNGDSPLGALAAAEQEDKAKSSRVWQASRSILCIPGYSKLDESAAIVLAQGLRRRGYGASAERADAMSVSRFFSLDLADTELVCICYVDRPSNAKTSLCSSQANEQKQIGIRDGLGARFGGRNFG